MSKRLKQSRNSTTRANGNEPAPGLYAGIKRCMRYFKRVSKIYTKPIKNPERYLNASRTVQ